jgi:predicted anti-sigma-YlaC factor YlaD
MLARPFNECHRRREHIALRLDGELSDFEAAALDVHLARCDDCRRYGADVAATTRLLRTATLEEPQHELVLPRHRRSHRLIVQAASAAAAVVVISGLSAVFGGIRADRPAPPAATTTSRAHVGSVKHNLRIPPPSDMRDQVRRVPSAV